MVTYAASQDIYLTGCEVLEKPASLDVSFRVVSPLPDQIQKITSLSDRNGYVAEVVTTLGLLANEKLPIGREYFFIYPTFFFKVNCYFYRCLRCTLPGILARLERELDPGSGQFELQPVVDPVLKRLYLEEVVTNVGMLLRVCKEEQPL